MQDRQRFAAARRGRAGEAVGYEAFGSGLSLQAEPSSYRVGVRMAIGAAPRRVVRLRSLSLCNDIDAFTSRTSLRRIFGTTASAIAQSQIELPACSHGQFFQNLVLIGSALINSSPQRSVIDPLRALRFE